MISFKDVSTTLHCVNRCRVIEWCISVCRFLCFRHNIRVHRKVPLTHRGRMTHICVSTLTIIGSDNGLSPGRRHAIIWTNDGILLIRTFRTHFSEIVSEIHTFSFKKMHFKMSSGKWWPSCLGLNVLILVISEWYIYQQPTWYKAPHELKHHSVSLYLISSSV